MKKILISLLLLVSALILSGCKKVGSKEDKIMFDEYFKNIDKKDEYKFSEYLVKFSSDGINYCYKYSLDYKDDGTIEIMKVIEHKNIYNLYSFNNAKMVTKEYDDWPNDRNSQIINEEENNITKKDFLEKYEFIKNPKYNFNLNNSKYYRTVIYGIHENQWEHYFEFPEDYVYEFQMFELNLNLKKCELYFCTVGSFKHLHDEVIVELTGIENDIEYKIIMSIN